MGSDPANKSLVFKRKIVSGLIVHQVFDLVQLAFGDLLVIKKKKILINHGLRICWLSKKRFGLIMDRGTLLCGIIQGMLWVPLQTTWSGGDKFTTDDLMGVKCTHNHQSTIK